MPLSVPSLRCVPTGKGWKLCKSKCPAFLLPETSPEVEVCLEVEEGRRQD